VEQETTELLLSQHFFISDNGSTSLQYTASFISNNGASSTALLLTMVGRESLVGNKRKLQKGREFR
jgi:hypothetical protein